MGKKKHVHQWQFVEKIGRDPTMAGIAGYSMVMYRKCNLKFACDCGETKEVEETNHDKDIKQ